MFKRLYKTVKVCITKTWNWFWYGVSEKEPDEIVKNTLGQKYSNRKEIAEFAPHALNAFIQVPACAVTYEKAAFPIRNNLLSKLYFGTGTLASNAGAGVVQFLLFCNDLSNKSGVRITSVALFSMTASVALTLPLLDAQDELTEIQKNIYFALGIYANFCQNTNPMDIIIDNLIIRPIKFYSALIRFLCNNNKYKQKHFLGSELKKKLSRQLKGFQRDFIEKEKSLTGYIQQIPQNILLPHNFEIDTLENLLNLIEVAEINPAKEISWCNKAGNFIFSALGGFTVFMSFLPYCIGTYLHFAKMTEKSSLTQKILLQGLGAISDTSLSVMASFCGWKTAEGIYQILSDIAKREFQKPITYRLYSASALFALAGCLFWFVGTAGSITGVVESLFDGLDHPNSTWNQVWKTIFTIYGYTGMPIFGFFGLNGTLNYFIRESVNFGCDREKKEYYFTTKQIESLINKLEKLSPIEFTEYYQRQFLGKNKFNGMTKQEFNNKKNTVHERNNFAKFLSFFGIYKTPVSLPKQYVVNSGVSLQNAN